MFIPHCPLREFTFLLDAVALQPADRLYIRRRWARSSRRHANYPYRRIAGLVHLSILAGFCLLPLLPVHPMAIPTAIGSGISFVLFFHMFPWRRILAWYHEEVLVLDAPKNHKINLS